MFSLLSLKYLIEALSDIDVNKYLEINSTLTILISDILKQNTFLFFFGFINPNIQNITQTIFTLEISNKFKNICPDYFFDLLQEIKKENSLIDYKYTKEYFHILQTIVKNKINKIFLLIFPKKKFSLEKFYTILIKLLIVIVI